jgi:hypothetical protein
VPRTRLKAIAIPGAGHVVALSAAAPRGERVLIFKLALSVPEQRRFINAG